MSSSELIFSTSNYNGGSRISGLATFKSAASSIFFASSTESNSIQPFVPWPSLSCPPPPHLLASTTPRSFVITCSAVWFSNRGHDEGMLVGFEARGLRGGDHYLRFRRRFGVIHYAAPVPPQPWISASASGRASAQHFFVEATSARSFPF
ncbi:hypothetical protein EVAR_11035_1 [Eumeta japonica]|uniref:Uncharacterized protein n=1 Tax=Eumeta variegata TaxID=151549 RepID=A0A4C1U4V3_EUMVA|nr:hypothetical protein EVAR_11035_1 [Eumeta japonica]